MFEIKTGKMKVLRSGVFHAIADSNGTTVIKLEDLSFIFNFEDKEGEKPSVKVSSNGNSATFGFINFTGPLGFGNSQPIKIGVFNNKELFFTYRISSLNDNTLRTFEYTFYEGDVVPQ